MQNFKCKYSIFLNKINFDASNLSFVWSFKDWEKQKTKMQVKMMENSQSVLYHRKFMLQCISAFCTNQGVPFEINAFHERTLSFLYYFFTGRLVFNKELIWT